HLLIEINNRGENSGCFADPFRRGTTKVALTASPQRMAIETPRNAVARYTDECRETSRTTSSDPDRETTRTHQGGIQDVNKQQKARRSLSTKTKHNVRRPHRRRDARCRA